MAAHDFPGGAFCVSLDFELGWGMRDKLSGDALEQRMRATREVIPRLLATFDDYGVRATWATVGLLLCESAEEARELAPVGPAYADASLSSSPTLASLEGGEREHPIWFAPSLVQQIVDTHGQELGAHTFAHLYPLEAGVTLADFEADLGAFRAVADRRGMSARCLVFPRNQYTPAHVSAAAALGFDVYRGNPPGVLNAPRPDHAQNPAIRAARLVESLAPLAPPSAANIPRPVFTARGAGARAPLAHPLNVPATRFLRPWSRSLRALDGARVARVTREIEHAATTGSLMHLWWHPHNFALDSESNFAGLHAILGAFSRARRKHGMRAMNMGDFAAAATERHA